MWLTLNHSLAFSLLTMCLGPHSYHVSLEEQQRASSAGTPVVSEHRLRTHLQYPPETGKGESVTCKFMTCFRLIFYSQDWSAVYVGCRLLIKAVSSWKFIYRAWLSSEKPRMWEIITQLWDPNTLERDLTYRQLGLDEEAKQKCSFQVCSSFFTENKSNYACYSLLTCYFYLLS